MTGIRRALVLAAAGSVLAAAAVGTAQAVFESTAAQTGNVATATVAPPTGITVTTTCDTLTATMRCRGRPAANREPPVTASPCSVPGSPP